MVLGTALVSADPISTEIVLARSLFADARAAEDAKDWRLAASKLREAIALKETGGLRFHLAYCEEQQGLLVEALVDYERSDDLTVGTNEEFRKQLPAKRESLRRRIPTITLQAPPRPSDASLTVDGHSMPAAVLGKPIPLNPGRHTLVLSAPDHSAFTTQVTLNETDAVVANAILTPLPKTAEVSPLKPAPAQAVSSRPVYSDVAISTGLPTRTYVLIGEAAIALAGAGVGIGYALEAAAQDDVVTQIHERTIKNDSEYCSNNPGNNECASLNDALENANRDRLISRIGFVGAGAAAAAFVGTLIFWRSPSKVAIIPSFRPGSAQLSVATDF
jgi:hypothetical protein